MELHQIFTELFCCNIKTSSTGNECLIRKIGNLTRQPTIVMSTAKQNRAIKELAL